MIVKRLLGLRGAGGLIALVLLARSIAMQYTYLPAEYVNTMAILLAALVLIVARVRSARKAKAFEQHFPVMRRGYLQSNIFECPMRPDSGITDLRGLRDYVARTVAARQQHKLRTIPPGCLPALDYAVAKWGDSVDLIDSAVKSVHDTVRSTIRGSHTVQSIVKEGKLIEAALIESIFTKEHRQASTDAEKFTSKKLYTSASDNAVFVSVDLREANVTSLRLLARLWGDEPLAHQLKDGWPAFVSRSTDIPFLQTGKSFRQIVLGTVDERHSNKFMSAIAAVEKALITCLSRVILQAVHEHTDLSQACTLHALISDEIVLRLSKLPRTPAMVDGLVCTIRAAVARALEPEFQDILGSIRIDAYEALSIRSGSQSQVARLMRTEKAGQIVCSIDVKGIGRAVSDDEAEALDKNWCARAAEYMRAAKRDGREPFVPLNLLTSA